MYPARARFTNEVRSNETESASFVISACSGVGTRNATIVLVLLRDGVVAGSPASAGCDACRLFAWVFAWSSVLVLGLARLGIWITDPASRGRLLYVVV
jgi:hypothetical protein